MAIKLCTDRSLLMHADHFIRLSFFHEKSYIRTTEFVFYVGDTKFIDLEHFGMEI